MDELHPDLLADIARHMAARGKAQLRASSKMLQEKIPSVQTNDKIYASMAEIFEVVKAADHPLTMSFQFQFGMANVPGRDYHMNLNAEFYSKLFEHTYEQRSDLRERNDQGLFIALPGLPKSIHAFKRLFVKRFAVLSSEEAQIFHELCTRIGRTLPSKPNEILVERMLPLSSDPTHIHMVFTTLQRRVNGHPTMYYVPPANSTQDHQAWLADSLQLWDWWQKLLVRLNSKWPLIRRQKEKTLVIECSPKKEINEIRKSAIRLIRALNMELLYEKIITEETEIRGLLYRTPLKSNSVKVTYDCITKRTRASDLTKGHEYGYSFPGPEIEFHSIE